jgi:hypothetical protein
MSRRACPVALACVALLADLSGQHAFAFAALLIAIPAFFAVMLDSYGDTLAARCGVLRPAAAAGGLLLIVFSAALRSPAVVGGVPRVAVTALALATLLSIPAAVRPRVPVAPRVKEPVTEAGVRDDERLAA